MHWRRSIKTTNLVQEMNKEEEPGDSENIVVEGFFYKEPCYTSKLCMADTCLCLIIFALGIVCGILLYTNIFKC